MKEEYGMLPENGFVADSDTPFSLFGEKIDEARQTLNRRIAIARVKRQGRRIHMEEVAPGVSISVPELEAEKYAGAWEEERDKGWNENIMPGASVQWYQEGSRSPNLGEVIEIDPEYQTYKVRDAYTGEVSTQTRVKIFSKKSGGFDPHAPGESIGQSQLWDEEPYALFEQGGKYYKVPLNDPMTDAGWSNVEEIDAEELARLKGEEPMTGLAKRAAVDETLVSESVEFLQQAFGKAGIDMDTNRELLGDALHTYLVEERGLDIPDDQFDEILPVVFERLGLEPKTAAGSWEMSDEKKLFDYYRQARDSGAPLDTLEDFRNAIPDPTWKKYLPLNESTYPQFKADADAYADHASDWMEKGYESGRIAMFEESKHPRGQGGQFSSGGGGSEGGEEDERLVVDPNVQELPPPSSPDVIQPEPGGSLEYDEQSGMQYMPPESDEFMQRMLEAGPGPGDKVRLKDGTETEWSEDIQDQVDAWMPEMGPQQWFANQEKPKRRSRRSSKFAQDVPEHGVLPQYQPFAALNEQPWTMNSNERWKLIWIYDDAANTNGEQYFASDQEALEYLEEMAAEGLIRKTGVREKSALEYPEEMGGADLRSDECPACSGMGQEIAPGVYKCLECMGLFGQVDSEQEALQWVNFRRFDDSGGSGQENYFDFSWPGGRAHGWYNPANGTMTQSG